MKRYGFHDAMLIAAIQPRLLFRSIFVGFAVYCIAQTVMIGLGWFSILIALGAGGAVGYYYFNEKRETIFVKDLVYGRDFSCNSVIELARKEAWLQRVSEYLRQVMESAKHWDGTESIPVEPLPKDEARDVILRGL